MRHTNFDNVVALFEGQATIPAAAPKGPAPAAVPSERRPNRPKRKDAETGLVIPATVYDYVAATPKRAGFWRVNARRLAEWRATVAPTPSPAEPPAPIVEAPEADHLGTAERVIVGAFHLVTFYGVTSWFLTVAPVLVAIAASTLVVGTCLFLLDGAFGHASKRRWLAIALLALVGIYGSAATWRADLAGEGADSLRAREAHAALETRIYRPLVAVADATDADADAADAAYATEIGDRGGRGPIARKLDAERATLRAAADKAERARAALAPFFGSAVASYSDAQLHAAAVSAAGVAGIEAPARDAYVEPALLVPALRALDGEPAACFGFGLAGGIDFVGIVLLGTAIRHRRRS